MLVTLVLVLLLALVLVALVLTGPLAEAVGSAVGVGSAAVTAWDIAKWPVLLAAVVVMIALLYYASPNAKLRGVKTILPGAALAVVIWLVASAAFAFYVANFGSYDKTYGALGGVVIFLVWVWLTNVAILLGAELNAERERSRQLRAGMPGAERELQLDERLNPRPSGARGPPDTTKPTSEVPDGDPEGQDPRAASTARQERPGRAGSRGAARPGRPRARPGLLAKFGIDPQDLLGSAGSPACERPPNDREDHVMTQIYDSPTESSTTEQANEGAGGGGTGEGQGRPQLRSQVDQRSTDAGHRVGGLASDVRAVGESLREQGKDQPARLAEQAADRAERLGATSRRATPIASWATSRTSAVGGRGP